MDRTNKEYAKLEDEKIIFSGKKNRIAKEIENIGMIEASVINYRRLKKENELITSFMIFTLIGISFNCSNLALIIGALISLGYLGTFNIYKYKKMKEIKNLYSNVDFDYFDLNESASLREELLKQGFEIDELIASINIALEKIQEKPVNNDYLYDNHLEENNQLEEKENNQLEEKEDNHVLVKKKGSKI